MLFSVTFTAKLELVFISTFENAFFRVFILKPTERAKVVLKNATRDFQNNPPFERSACFVWKSVKVSNVFSALTLKQIFWKKKKNWSTVFELKPLRLKAHHFHWKLLCQKPMLTQIEWQLRNGLITKRGVLPVTTFFWKIFSSFRTS